jgi:putative endonuclease
VTADQFGVPYTGVTADIAGRMTAHRGRTGSKFARRWECDRLVLVEHHDTIEGAIIREKALKNWKRQWKLPDQRVEPQLG